MSQQPAHQDMHTNVINLFTGKPLGDTSERLTRIAPELEGMEMLYTNDSTPDRLYSLKIVCWGMRESGEVVGLVPWLNEVFACVDINDPLNGRWQGYRDPHSNEVFYEAPNHKVVELQSTAQYYPTDDNASSTEALQEIPDTIGTHAVLTSNGFQSFLLIEVLSWRLLANGKVQAMLIDEDNIESTPVLPGDNCLYAAQEHESFRYFFQHKIANKIKAQDPEALAAVSLLIEG